LLSSVEIDEDFDIRRGIRGVVELIQGEKKPELTVVVWI